MSRGWLLTMADIGIALFKSYLYQCRNPLNYRVVSRSTVSIREGGGAVSEEVTFVGVVRDVPDVTSHSIIHKWVLVKTFYGEWHGEKLSSSEGHTPDQE